MEDWGKGRKLEPITHFFGENHPKGSEYNFGKGGEAQIVTGKDTLKFDSVTMLPKKAKETKKEK